MARCWVRPPKLSITSGANNGKFNSSQRCYEISNSENKAIDKLEFSLEANADSPVVNPAFVIRNWGDKKVQLKVNGKEISPGKAFRMGHIRRLNQYDLVIWLEMESESSIDISLVSQ